MSKFMLKVNNESSARGPDRFFNDLAQQYAMSATNSSLNIDVNDENQNSIIRESNSLFNPNIYEFLSKLEKTNRLMKNLTFSDTYKAVIKSFLSENLLDGSKNYDPNTLGNKTTGTNFIEPPNNNSNQTKFDYRKNSLLTRQTRYLSSAGLNQSINLPTNKRNSLLKNSIHTVKISDYKNAKIDPYVTNNNNNNNNHNNSNNIDNRLSKTKSQRKKCHTAPQQRSVSPVSSNLKSINHRPKSNSSSKSGTSLCKNPVPNFLSSSFSKRSERLTDLILDGYRKSELRSETPILSHDFVDKSFASFDEEESTSKFKDESVYLTPAFQIKRYNLQDRLELEKAKNELFERYSIVKKSHLRSLSVQPELLNDFPKAKISSHRIII